MDRHLEFLLFRMGGHMKKACYFGTIFSLCLICLMGCGKTKQADRIKEKEGDVQKEDQVVLSLFYSSDDVKWVSTLEGICEDFMREFPNITLEMKHSEAGIYTEELKIKEATDEFPDIYEVENPYTFYEAGKLGGIPEEIGDLVEEPLSIQGEVYAVPSYTTTHGIIYNQVIFKQYGLEVPRNYGEFLEVCETLSDNHVVPLAIGGSKSESISYWLNYFFQSDVIAPNPYWQQERNNGEVSFQDEDAIKMLRDYHSLMTSNYILENSINMNDNHIVSQMIEGNIAMVYTGSGMISQIVDAYPDATLSDKDSEGESLEIDPVKCRVGWFFMPDNEGEVVALREVKAAWGISKECSEDKEKREAVIQFFQYFYRKSVYQDILQAVFGVHTTKDAVIYASPGVHQGLLVDYRYAQKSSLYLGNDQTPEGFSQDMYEILNALATDVISVETAAQKLDESWDEYKE